MSLSNNALRALAFTLFACSSSSGPPANPNVLSTLPAYTPPAGSLEFYTPILEVPAGGDQTFCTFTDQITTDETLVHTSFGMQSPFGHHLIFFYDPTPEHIGETIPCGAADMERFRQMMGGSGGEGGQFWTPPDNVATRIPKGVQFVLQTHWINTTGQPQKVQAHAAVIPQTAKADIIAGSVAFVNTNFVVQPNASASSTTDCKMDHSHKLFIAVPHEHEWGTHVKATIDRASGGTDMIHDGAFDPSQVSHPKFESYSTDKPLLLGVGDTVHLSCDWANTTTDPLLFPREMCVLFGWSMEDDDAHCTDGVWDHSNPNP